MQKEDLYHYSKPDNEEDLRHQLLVEQWQCE